MIRGYFSPSRRRLSAELFRLLMPLDSLDWGLCLWAVGDAGKVGEGVRSRGDKMPGRRREPNAMVTRRVGCEGHRAMYITWQRAERKMDVSNAAENVR